MKKLILVFLAAAGIMSASAQSEKYQQKMGETLALMDSAKTIPDLQKVAAQFERIGDTEKNQWLPYYYAALANIYIGWRDENADKDKLAEKTKSIIARAQAIENNAELFILLNMVASQQLMVNPQQRWMKYGAEASAALEQAKQLDPSNPRIYYLEGMSVFNTPAAFGGGKDKAKPLFEKSLELFRSFQPKSDFHPKWGQQNAESMLAKCSS